MELRDAVRRRRMVRTYRPDVPVPAPLLARLLDDAQRAPSAGFAQGVEFLALTGPDAVARYWDLTRDAGPADSWLRGMRTAPVLVLVLSDPGRYRARYAEPDKGGTHDPHAEWPVPWWDTDAAMAAMLLLLGAVDAGLGACFFGVPAARHAAVRAGFGIPGELRLVGVVSLGTPAPDRRSPSLRRGRRPLADVVHVDRYGGGGVMPTTAP